MSQRHQSAPIGVNARVANTTHGNLLLLLCGTHYQSTYQEANGTVVLQPGNGRQCRNLGLVTHSVERPRVNTALNNACRFDV